MNWKNVRVITFIIAINLFSSLVFADSGKLVVDSFKVKIPDYIKEFGTVKAIAIGRLGANLPEKLNHPRNDLCVMAEDIIKPITDQKRLKFYGCDDPNSKNDPDNTLYLSIVLEQTGGGLYDGSIYRRGVKFEIFGYRLNPYHTIAPDYYWSVTYPTSTPEEIEKYQQYFSRIYAFYLESIAKNTINAEQAPWYEKFIRTLKSAIKDVYRDKNAVKTNPFSRL